MRVEIYSLAATGESETVEFKKSTGQLHAAMETLCGFLNGEGGTVLFGVLDNGKVVGQPLSDKSMQEIAGALRKFEPAVKIEIDITGLENGNSVIALHAYPDRMNIPFVFEGKPWQRTGTVTHVMPQARYQKLLLERMAGTARWENQVAVGCKLDDIDAGTVRRMVRAGVESGRMPDCENLSIRQILEKLQVMDDDKLNYAAIVLFGKDAAVYKHLTQCELRMARFAGVTKREFIDNRQVHGNAFDLLDEAINFCARNLRVRGTFEDGRLERKDELQVPYKALREAMSNAICHRDYSVYGGAISLAIYDDRLEVWSPGALPYDVAIEKLKQDHQSRPRNPWIADAFYKSGKIEKWGRGTQNMVEYCREAGLPEPEYLLQDNSMVVRFRFAEERYDFEPGKKVLTDQQQKIVDYVKAKGKASSKELQQVCELSADRANRILKALIDESILSKEGAARATVYVMKK